MACNYMIVKGDAPEGMEGGVMVKLGWRELIWLPDELSARRWIEDMEAFGVPALPPTPYSREELRRSLQDLVEMAQAAGLTGPAVDDARRKAGMTEAAQLDAA